MKQATIRNLKTKFFAYIQATGKSIVRIGDLQNRLALTVAQEHSLLKRLVRSGLVLRLMRGVYLAPQKFPAGGYWQPNEYYLIAKYMEVVGGEYYIGGWVAIHHYHLTTQVPNQFIIYNTKLSGKRFVGQLSLQFIKVSLKRISGVCKISIPHYDVSINISSLARTLLDSVNDWSRYNTLPIAYEWIKCYRNDAKTISELIDLISNVANKSTLRRLGYVLSHYVSKKELKPLVKRLKKFHDWVRLDPTGNYQGTTDKTWGIIHKVNIRF